MTRAQTCELPHSALVVDDDDFVRGAIAQMLRRLGVAEVRTADDGRKACETLSRDGPAELIVCDLMMPGGDGVEMMSEVSRLNPAGRLVLVSSAEARLLRSARELAEGQGLDVLGVLSKPVRQSDLLALLDRAPAPPKVAPAAPAPAAPISAEQLRAALAAREFTIDVQPQLCLRTQRIIGCEALVRWNSPTLGRQPPDRFLPPLAAAGLMPQLNDVVVAAAMASCAGWHRLGLDLRIAINFSPDTLADRDLPARLARLAGEAGFPPSRIVVEVTESGVMQDSQESLGVLTRLRLRGMELSIDDFGTGYSTMERLQRVPFTELKIDRRFVSAALADPEARGIVEANVSLARSLDLLTVAEGVETLEDLRLMRALGCDVAQGYFISRPMPPAALPDWLTGQRMLACLHQHPACPVAHDCKLAGRLCPKT